MARYVIAEYPPCRCGNEDCPTYDLVHVLDLPDAEHIHLTRRADGGWDAVPLAPFAVTSGVLHEATPVVGARKTLWVDAPVQGDDR